MPHCDKAHTPTQYIGMDCGAAYLGTSPKTLRRFIIEQKLVATVETGPPLAASR
jgi:hypothetical protein